MSATTVPEIPQLDASLGLIGLTCRECGRAHDVGPGHVCDECFGPLEASYDYERVAAAISPESIASGPSSLWRYLSLLPSPENNRVDIGAGFTPLREAPRLAAELGLRRLWLKNDAANPSHSFKDRVVSVALSAAKHFGFETVACASTGNLANAVAAHAAATGLRSIVFVPVGLESGKLAATAVFGGHLVEIEGSYDDVNRLCAQLSEVKPWAFVNVNLRPYYSEGSKTLAFEVAEQLGWRSPDTVVAPVASGSLLTKLGKGFRELRKVGLIDDAETRLFGAQADGCSPVARAFDAGAEDVAPMRPDTIAKSLAIGTPADGYYALREVRATGGAVTAVPEGAVALGIRLLAETEGLFTEAAGGVAISALEKLVANGTIAPDEETVVLLTGMGLKTLETLGDRRARRPIAASVAAVEEFLSERRQ
ncbi:MAG: threonine synthase [Actinomycetota bacterium]|nr:threonine synthase [Actinomycetota bacterium]